MARKRRDRYVAMSKRRINIDVIKEKTDEAQSPTAT